MGFQDSKYLYNYDILWPSTHETGIYMYLLWIGIPHDGSGIPVTQVNLLNLSITGRTHCMASCFPWSSCAFSGQTQGIVPVPTQNEMFDHRCWRLPTYFNHSSKYHRSRRFPSIFSQNFPLWTNQFDPLWGFSSYGPPLKTSNMKCWIWPCCQIVSCATGSGSKCKTCKSFRDREALLSQGENHYDWEIFLGNILKQIQEYG